MDWDYEDDEADLREITRRLLPDTVIWTTDWTTGALKDQIEREVFDVNPPFQRRSVWNDKKASLLIESLIVGCPVPAITLAELPKVGPAGEQYVVIDGKQRLNTLKRFMVDSSLRLTGLEIMPQYEGFSYADLLAKPAAARFPNVPIRTVVLRNWKRDEVLQFVFNRLNTQVTPLSTHELRRSLISGPFTEYLDKRSAQSAGIKRVLKIEEPDYRLRDAELWLRALAFTQDAGAYQGNLKQFLDDFTRKANHRWRRQDFRGAIEEASAEVELAIDATYAVFGHHAFQKWDSNARTYSGRFNRAIFDVMMTSLTKESLRDLALSAPNVTREAFERLSGQREFNEWLSSTTKTEAAVSGRTGAWQAALESTRP